MVNMAKKRKLVLFDSLHREKKEDTFSVWAGKQGRYFFKHLEQDGSGKRPVAQVYLNRKYLTGVFPAKKPGEFSGDIKQDGQKEYLLLQVKGKRELEIYIRK